MGTGYTECVRRGQATTLKEYVYKCIGAFFREDYTPPKTSYLQELLQEAETELARLESMSEEEFEKIYEAEYIESVRLFNERRESILADKHRYTLMLEKVREYPLPSPEHKAFHNFLVSQLEDSIRFDCPDIEEFRPSREQRSLSKDILQAKQDVDYYREKVADERNAIESSTLWLKQLKESLE